MSTLKERLDKMKSEVHKKYGEGSAFILNENKTLFTTVIPTGSFLLDEALGVGGLPRGRIIEIYGPESSGKTTLCQHIIAEAQRLGGVCAFVDTEHALDPNYAAKCGVNVDELIVSQPDTGEQGLETALIYTNSGADVVIVDSVAALTPKAEIDGEMGDSHMGLQARLMSQACRKLSHAIKASGTVFIFTNQLRQKIGVVFGNPETTTGGMALRFYASVRIDLRKRQPLKIEGEVVGHVVKASIKKNKVAPPFREAEFDIIFNRGIDRAKELIDYCAIMPNGENFISKAGAFYTLMPNEATAEKLHGIERTKEFLRNPNRSLINEQLWNDIENGIREYLRIPQIIVEK